MLTTLILYATIASAVYYLLARAEITRFFWSRYPAPVEKFITCAACSGAWLWLGCAAINDKLLHLPFLGVLDPGLWHTYVITALFGIVWTPIAAAVHTYAWSALSDEYNDEE